MARTDRLSQATPAITALLDRHPTGIFRWAKLTDLLEEHRDQWRIPGNIGVKKLITHLLEHTKLRYVQLGFHRPETLYTWGIQPTHLIAVNAKPGAYLCHGTALHVHALADAPTNAVYANQEQRPIDPPSEPPTQASVNLAFRRRQRVTNNVARLGRMRIVMLNGKHTARLGVMQKTGEDGREFSVTGLERTLIDACVRPAYAGGSAVILKAYKRAAPRVDPELLASTLQDLQYIYPYQQAIGFYLERAGVYSAAALRLFRKQPFELDFYLDYAIKDKAYSQAWRLYYPRELDPA